MSNIYKFEAEHKTKSIAEANEMEHYNRTHKPRTTLVNICNGIANWNTCAYINEHRALIGSQGCECWKQDRTHKCVRCVECKRY